MPAASLQRIELQLPSGLAGNLFASALCQAGLPRGILESIPGQLQLDGFDLFWDGNVVDGRGGLGSGTVDEMFDLVGTLEIGAELAQQIVLARWSAGDELIMVGETWADTAFDCAAAAVGLTYLGRPELVVTTPLPMTQRHNTVTEYLLSHWVYTSFPVGLELVSPTAAAILATAATQRLDEPTMKPEAELYGRYAKEHGLPPVFVAFC